MPDDDKFKELQVKVNLLEEKLQKAEVESARKEGSHTASMWWILGFGAAIALLFGYSSIWALPRAASDEVNKQVPREVEKQVSDRVPIEVAKTVTGKVQAEAELSAQRAALSASQAKQDGATISQLLDEVKAEQHTVPLGGIVMWWGNWEADKTKLTDYELCDGRKVYTKGSQLEGVTKPNLTGAFPRGAAQGVADVIAGGKRHEGNETISLRHRHEIDRMTLSSDQLWVPFSRKMGPLWWTDSTSGPLAGLNDRGSVPAGQFNRASYFPPGSGETLSKADYPGTAVYGDIQFPNSLTEYSGDEHVDILPTYQEVLFLIRVK